jgi:threonine dehydrogenase-like Zn-dependent dehydrogenase
MRYPAAEKLAIIRLVEQSHLPAKQTLDRLGIPRTTFYRWYDKYVEGGVEALEDRSPMPAMRPRSVIMQLGLGGDMKIPVQTMTAKEIDFRGSFRFHEEFETAIKLMQLGLIDVKPLISHTMPMEKAVEAFELASDRAVAMKIQLRFN